jgi:hypothetical protein
MTSGFIFAVVLRERPPRAMHPGASGQMTLRGPCDCAYGVNTQASRVPRLPHTVTSTVNLAEVVSKLADAAQPLTPHILVHFARTDSPESTVEANADYLTATATPWTCVQTRTYTM